MIRFSCIDDRMNSVLNKSNFFNKNSHINGYIHIPALVPHSTSVFENKRFRYGHSLIIKTLGM
jgi:hypothetical protein